MATDEGPTIGEVSIAIGGDEPPRSDMDYVRPGPKAPIPDPVDEACMKRIQMEDMTVSEVMAVADHLRRIVRNYRYDPAWPPIRRRLLEVEVVLADRVDRRTHTALDAYRLGEVRKWLNRTKT